MDYCTIYGLSLDVLQVIRTKKFVLQKQHFQISLLLPQLFINYGSIFFLLLSLPIAFLMDLPEGFRISCLMSAACSLCGCILRLFARSSSPISIAMLHLSYIINAIGSPVAISAPALLANSWFPASERGLATGVAVACNTFGLVFSCIIGPIIVKSADVDSLMTYMRESLAAFSHAVAPSVSHKL
jgi:FLVCR family MFS transporter 7